MGDFLIHNNMDIGLRYDPAPYVLYTDRQLPEPSSKGVEWGLVVQNSQGTCHSTKA